MEKENEINSCKGSCHLSKQIQNQVDAENNEEKIVLLDFVKIPHLFASQKENNVNLIQNILPFNSYNKEIKIIDKPLLPPPKFM